MYEISAIANKVLFLASRVGEPVTNLKLQKLLYYEQGYHLAMFDAPLFADEIEAWMYGPVVPASYYLYSRYGDGSLPFPSDDGLELTDGMERSLFGEVFAAYNRFTASALVDMTHSETPWKSVYPPYKGNIIGKDTLTVFFKQKLREDGAM